MCSISMALPGTAPIRVLIADPDESLLSAYRESFWEDFEIFTACSGLECIGHLREGIPDVLVLEPLLPWGGGDGVLAMMHETPSLVNVPVMILTSCRDVLVLESVAPFRIRDYCVKPLSPELLAARIRHVLDYESPRELVFEGPVALV